ncbi:GDSL-type esterase/lipase family protein [Microbacterium sp. P06]|uniref:SGNH/GDSL hydrolase family protein n=1 Tax=Microbacterium sp. P06 TaxID=3366949 RepID=UPI0037469A93
MRRIIAAIVGALGLALTGCSGASAAPPPDDGRPLVAFYGDSYTLGTGASSPEARWSTRIAQDHGWREFNPSVNGLGFVNNRDARGVDLPGDIIAAEPDIVIVTMGLNDVFSFEARGTAIRDRIDDDFERLATALPEARFIVVEPFWYTAERPEGLETIIGWVSDAAADIDAEYIPGASSWIQGRQGEMADDGLHPNDSGYDQIYRNMKTALAERGL